MHKFLWIVIVAALAASCGRSAGAQVTVQARDMRFVRDQVQVRAGEPVTLRLVNRDAYAHTFDLDEYDIHVPLAGKETTTVTFMPEASGTYTFYCGAPGHLAAGMVGTLIVEPGR